jgi:hypothetical protein
MAAGAVNTLTITGLSINRGSNRRSKPAALIAIVRPTHEALQDWRYHGTAELPRWLHPYNWHRPHGSLKAKTPINRLDLTEDNLLRLHI